MPRSFTFTEAWQILAYVLKIASREGEVRITHKGGQVFVIRPEKTTRSPLDVAGVNIGITAEEINEIVREGRERE